MWSRYIVFQPVGSNGSATLSFPFAGVRRRFFLLPLRDLDVHAVRILHMEAAEVVAAVIRDGIEAARLERGFDLVRVPRLDAPAETVPQRAAARNAGDPRRRARGHVARIFTASGAPTATTTSAAEPRPPPPPLRPRCHPLGELHRQPHRLPHRHLRRARHGHRRPAACSRRESSRRPSRRCPCRSRLPSLLRTFQPRNAA